MNRPTYSLAYLYPLIIAGIWFALFLIRFSAPADYLDDDQQRPIAYAMDAVVNGNWIAQIDDSRDVASKPPFSTWMIAILSVIMGGVTSLSLALPSGLAILGISLMIFFIARARLSPEIGLVAAVIFLASQVALRQLTLLRSDPVFSVLVFGAAVLFLFCLEGRRFWIALWLVLAAATLTKGPLALLLVGTGALVLLWEKLSPTTLDDSQTLKPRYGKDALIGAGLWLLISGGWFLLAYWVLREALVDKMIESELINQALSDERERPLFKQLLNPTMYFTTRFLPWSLFAFAGFYFVARGKDFTPTGLRLLRFLTVYFFAGIIIFMIGSHQRADHLYPLIPAAAIVAAIPLTRWILAGIPKKCLLFALAVGGAAMLYATVYYHILRPMDRDVVRTTLIKEFSGRINAEAGRGIVINSFDSPFGLQFNRGTMLPRMTMERVIQAFGSDVPFFLATRESRQFNDPAREAGVAFHVVDFWPRDDRRLRLIERISRHRDRFTIPYLAIISNVETFDTDVFAVYTDEFKIVIREAQVTHISPRRITVQPTGPQASVEVINESEGRQRFRVDNGETGARNPLTLAANESITVRLRD